MADDGGELRWLAFLPDIQQNGHEDDARHGIIGQQEELVDQRGNERRLGFVQQSIHFVCGGNQQRVVDLAFLPNRRATKCIHGEQTEWGKCTPRSSRGPECAPMCASTRYREPRSHYAELGEGDSASLHFRIHQDRGGIAHGQQLCQEVEDLLHLLPTRERRPYPPLCVGIHLLPLKVEVLHEHGDHGGDFAPSQIVHLQANALNHLRYLVGTRIQIDGAQKLRVTQTRERHFNSSLNGNELIRHI